MIDAHVHVWSQDCIRYPFGPIQSVTLPADTCAPDDYRREAEGLAITALVLIQPRIYGYDHSYLFDAAAASRCMTRVVPALNPARPSAVEELRALACDARTSGIRITALGNEPAEWLLSPEACRVWKYAEQLMLPVTVLVDAPQLPLIEGIARRCRELPLVIDHMARCGHDQYPKWGPLLVQLADYPSVHVKVSAMAAMSGAPFPYGDMWPLVNSLYDAYGPERLLWGSDWPHSRSHGTLERSAAAVTLALGGAAQAGLQELFGGTAGRLFGLDTTTETKGAP